MEQATCTPHNEKDSTGVVVGEKETFEEDQKPTGSQLGKSGMDDRIKTQVEQQSCKYPKENFSG